MRLFVQRPRANPAAEPAGPPPTIAMSNSVRSTATSARTLKSHNALFGRRLRSTHAEHQLLDRFCAGGHVRHFVSGSNDEFVMRAFLLGEIRKQIAVRAGALVRYKSQIGPAFDHVLKAGDAATIKNLRAGRLAMLVRDFGA